ncbi:MAG TPA: hypothetical protein VJZ71_05820 [Phycisphaerae bacterium]|nr:hypothetical protein [Phycisphaerae bacterium]
MLDVHAASDCAVRKPPESGDLPDIQVIHARQRNEGHEPHFSLAVARCSRPRCRLFRECMAVLDFDPDSRSRSEIASDISARYGEPESVSSAEPSTREAVTLLLG